MLIVSVIFLLFCCALCLWPQLMNWSREKMWLEKGEKFAKRGNDTCLYSSAVGHLAYAVSCLEVRWQMFFSWWSHLKQSSQDHTWREMELSLLCQLSWRHCMLLLFLPGTFCWHWWHLVIYICLCQKIVMNLPRESACVYVLQLNRSAVQLKTSKHDFSFYFCSWG